MKRELRTVAIVDRLYKVEIEPFKGEEGGFMCCLWELDTKANRVHLSSIQYGPTEDEVVKKIDRKIWDIKSRYCDKCSALLSGLFCPACEL